MRYQGDSAFLCSIETPLVDRMSCEFVMTNACCRQLELLDNTGPQTRVCNSNQGISVDEYWMSYIIVDHAMVVDGDQAV